MTFVLSSNQIGQQITKLAHRKNVGWLAGPGGLQSVYDGLKSDYDDYSNYDDMHPAIVRDAKYSVADKKKHTLLSYLLQGVRSPNLQSEFEYLYL